MEPVRYSYSPIVARPRIVWPGEARVTLWVVPNIEHYEYLPAFVRTRNPWPRSPYPDVLGYGTRDYGNRVGLWRMFDIMDRHEIRCTVSLSLSVYEHYPEIREAIEARRWAIMSHGVYNTRYHWDLSEDEEREQIAEAAAIYRRTTGRELAGWFSPAISHTLNTPDLVAQAGIRYIADFYHDDQPTPLKVRQGTLISVPYSMDINDAMIYRQPLEAEDFAQMIMDHFDTVWREGEAQGRSTTACRLSRRRTPMRCSASTASARRRGMALLWRAAPARTRAARRRSQRPRSSSARADAARSWQLPRSRRVPRERDDGCHNVAAPLGLHRAGACLTPHPKSLPKGGVS